jgi:hypothetical protein
MNLHAYYVRKFSAKRSNNVLSRAEEFGSFGCVSKTYAAAWGASAQWLPLPPRTSASWVSHQSSILAITGRGGKDQCEIAQSLGVDEAPFGGNATGPTWFAMLSIVEESGKLNSRRVGQTSALNNTGAASADH